MKKRFLFTAGLMMVLGVSMIDSKVDAAEIVKKEKISSSIYAVKSWDRWKNFDYKVSKGKSKGVYTAKYRYKLNNGRTYYSLYRNNEWQGYTNIGAFKEIKWNNVKDYLVYANTNFTTYGNKELSKSKTQIKKQEIPMIVKGYYIINGKKYVSLYSTSDVWLGYTEEKNVSKPKWINTKDKTVIVKYDTKFYKSMIHICQNKNEQKLSKNEEVVIKGQYKLGQEESIVLSLYDKKDNWIGYVWGSTFRYDTPSTTVEDSSTTVEDSSTTVEDSSTTVEDSSTTVEEETSSSSTTCEDNKTESDTSEPTNSEDKTEAEKPSKPEQPDTSEKPNEDVQLYILNSNDMYKARSVLTIANEIYSNKNLQLENTYSFNQFEKYMFVLDRMIQKADDYWGGEKADFTNEELKEITDTVEENMKKLVITPNEMKEALNNYKGSDKELKKKAQDFIDKQDMRMPQHWRDYYLTVKQLKNSQ